MNVEPVQIGPRGMAVLRLVIEGYTNAEIACELSVSPRSVQAHMARLFAKTGTRSRTQLAVHALRAGLVPLHPDQADE